MREMQIHDGLMAWLKKNGIFYIHSTFGKRATMTKDAPDFIILHCGRALLLECKTAKGGLTAGQTESFRKIQEQSGMVVQIARSVEQAVTAVQEWLGVVKDLSGGVESRHAVDAESQSSTCRPTPETGDGARITSESSASPAQTFIAEIGGINYVCTGDRTPGGTFTRVRKAGPSDIMNIR